jgi:MoaA/NifB/PqqE/SkfB family radical SAM enzyme
MCDIWKIRQVREISVEDLRPHLESLLALGVGWVVLSGGEPQLHSEFSALSQLIRANGIRVTLLTAGLLLESQARSVAEVVDDVIVSLDGPPEIHDRIRGVPGSFARLERGVRALRRASAGIVVRGRSTVQKDNCIYLRATVQAAKEIGLDSISFLAADLTSAAFNRPQGWTPDRQTRVALDANEVRKLEVEVEALLRDCSADIAAGFVAESAEKLRRIVLHFRAHLGETAPTAPRCNAPWVSAVIEADGAVKPCFFHRSLGNIREKLLVDIINGPEAIRFREQLDIPRNEICQRCVCSLHLST